MRRDIFSCVVAGSLFLSCMTASEFDEGIGEPTALTLAEGIGPTVVFDPLRLPDAEMPFPNDAACAFDPTSPTLCRPNLSTNVPTNVDRRLKMHVNRLTGFSTYGPLTVSFDGRLDLTTVSRDTVIVVKVPKDEKEAETIKPVLLDLGEGSFPMNRDPISFFPNDPFGASDNMAFGFQNYGDVDGDGKNEYLWHYETATNTLLIRPLLPLDEASKYACVLTKGLRGFSDRSYGPIRSPFPRANHPSQTNDLKKVLPILKRLGVEEKDIAFAWTFTTQDVTGEVRAIREGLWGRGPLANLDREISRKFLSFDDSGITFDGSGEREGMPYDPKDNIVIIQAEYLNSIINFIAPFFDAAAAFDFSLVDYFAFGWLESPDFLATPDRVWDLDVQTGKATYKKGKVPILVAVPKSSSDCPSPKCEKGVQPCCCPPYPVVLYAHGNGTSRLEAILLANAVSRYCLAVVSMDEVGYGPLAPNLTDLLKEIGIDVESDPNDPLAMFLAYTIADLMLPNGRSEVEGMDFFQIYDRLKEVGFFRELMVNGRAIDRNGDGKIYNGEGFFVPFPFEQRDVFRQMQVDYMAMVRVLRSLSQDKVPPPVENPAQKSADDLMPNLVAGDLNADGVLDFGGPDVPIYMAGTSLGGIVTVLVSGVEPEITAVAPLVGGAGLVDVFTRSRLRGFFDDSFYYVMGPILGSCVLEDGIYITWNADSADGYGQNRAKWRCDPDKTKKVAVQRLEQTGKRLYVHAENLKTKQHAYTVSDESGGFSVNLASDIGDRWQVTIKTVEADGTLSDLDTFVAVSPYEGLGRMRNTPDFRRNVGIYQAVMDPADPANLAMYLIRRRGTERPTNILQTSVIADTTVPFGAQLALARISGSLGLDDETMLEWNRKFIEHKLPQGADFDVDDIDHNNQGFGPLPPVATSSGVSAVRFANSHGFHEYMAVLNPKAPCDIAQYTHNQIAIYLANGGKRVEDATCIMKNDCPCLLKPSEPCQINLDLSCP